MPQISDVKIKKIKENILAFLYENSPKALYTVTIARELARDEEFIKKLLQQLEKAALVSRIKKNTKGIVYSRREKWLLTAKAYEAYKTLQ